MLKIRSELENTDEIIRNLFDPRKHSRFVPQNVKYKYLQHFLESKWKEICGDNLAKNCAIYKIDGSDLYIKTTNSLLANELYMMQDLFLQKINAYLLGRIIIKKIYFKTGVHIETKKDNVQVTDFVPEYEYTTCPRCNSQMLKGQKICSVCDRQQREELQHKLGELLKIQPWLKYEDCLIYYKCDKIMFTAVKDRLKNYYFEKVRLGYASKKESLLAVLFLTEKQPEEITSNLYDNALEYLRRDQSVSAFGSRFYGKK